MRNYKVKLIGELELLTVTAHDVDLYTDGEGEGRVFEYNFLTEPDKKNEQASIAHIPFDRVEYIVS
jgi:hypothetical protein